VRIGEGVNQLRPQPRLIIYGIDSADWDLLQPLLEAKRLPTLGALIERATVVPLRSTIPPLTACAWPSIMTGTNPGKHGMFGFLSPQGRPRLFTNADRQAPALWEILSQAGLRVGVFNVPLTYPPDAVEGFMVAGEMGAPDFSAKIFHPPHLFPEAQAVVPLYPLRPPRASLPERVRERLWQELVTARHRLCLHLVRHQPVDVLIVVVNYVDHIQHAHLKSRRVGDTPDLVAWAYEQADRLLAELLEATEGERRIVILSDHGAGLVEGYLDVAAFLYQGGWLSYRKSVTRGRMGRAVYKAAARIYDRLISRSLPPAWARRLAFAAKEVGYWTLIDWQGTKAFFDGSYGIVVNSPGRSGRPTVSETDREAVARDIAAALNDLVDPFTGQKDIKAFLAAELYEGPALPYAPDVVVMPREFGLALFAGPPFAERLFYTEAELEQMGSFRRLIKEGRHRLEGILVVSPPLSTQPAGACVLDVAPTVLSLLGLPVPPHMDGVDLTATAERRPAGAAGQPEQSIPASQPQAVYSPAEEEAVVKRLRELGYL
jgi:predicted AlkP superfamily phosphohydrolase/phosphomutase